MMGRLTHDQEQFFYSFRLDRTTEHASIRFLFSIRVLNPTLAAEYQCQKKQQFCDGDHKHLRMNGLPVTAGGTRCAREFNMRSEPLILLVALLILFSVMGAANNTGAITRVIGERDNVTVIEGLHIATPNNMKTFPAELVPVP
jgi:hypothetical protein